MTGRWVIGAGAVLMLLASACGADPADSGASAPDERAKQAERLERMADDEPAELLARVRAAYARTVLRASIIRTGEATARADTYAFVAGPDAWRVELPPGEEAGPQAERAVLLAVGEEICFDRGYRPLLSGIVAPSYGVVDFDPAPWSCTPAGFGLNPLATFDPRREDPRWRIENLTDAPGSATAQVEQVDGEPLLHLRTTGVSGDGPLDPARPAYDLWVDGDHLPVRMETTDLTWVFDYPDDLDDELTAPAAAQRGSYGYTVGPGQGEAKACYYGGGCPLPAEPTLTWGDGRHRRAQEGATG